MPMCFTHKNYLNSGNESLSYKHEVLRAIFCSHTLCSALTKHFYSCNALFIVDVYKMVMLFARPCCLLSNPKDCIWIMKDE